METSTFGPKPLFLEEKQHPQHKERETKRAKGGVFLLPTERVATIDQCPYVTGLGQPDVRKAERAEWVLLTAARDVLVSHQGEVPQAFANTTSPKKIEGVQGIVDQRFCFPTSVISFPPQKYTEPFHPSARKTSNDKARASFQETGIASVGMDASFQILHPRLGWLMQGKLDRMRRELTERELISEYLHQKEMLVHVETVKLFWEVALSFVNGHQHTASNIVVIEANPFTEEEFDAFFLDAYLSDMLYNSNARGRLIEYLVMYNKIKKMGNIPHQYVQMSGRMVDARPFLQEYRGELGNQAIREITQTVPIAILGMR
ncbi:MAG: hypothetical protein UX04_C0007G0034 [Microgenomates group bacterium GW2011_GWF2_45_18]|nr:MAG: hypothetical protein UW18_C0002G0129 [Microgenomates group bacterium GW2011_GWF1_44_10]KKU01445.1 MAG: hypothetical protein UX04_C0007G0034 [Microgenomates group bacterium GW2011_GWF2_45_18]OGJ41519.1 MAG: hypothetical protein A2378_00555 [Candidatus Pacebacteria bacterium RIFOXYB1_FULL_44_10]HAU98841.1 hypothetical protein [Candidatus Paceibacterota bacterium]HAX01202.1 hypothetical protein [Candidatus Paceibacterota bacterium]